MKAQQIAAQQSLHIDVYESNIFAVKSTSAKGHHRRVNLANGRARTTQLVVHRFAAIGPSDKIYVTHGQSRRIDIVSTEDPADRIAVEPHYETRTTVKLGADTHTVVCTEITTPEHLSDYTFLESFHYKTSAAILDNGDAEGSPNRDTGGRRAVIVAYIRVGTRWQPVGYIELQMPLMMCKPRHVLFANAFNHPSRPVSWLSWDLESMKRYVNLIARIARIVVSPDFRGLGLAKTLITSAREFAAQRWHIHGRRPLFLEISAEMLRHVDFVSSSGLTFIGETEGNLERVHKDLSYMSAGHKDSGKMYAISGGIMSLQKRYLTALKDLAESSGREFKEVLANLARITESVTAEGLADRLNSLQPDEWYTFRKVLRLPIPYYLCGLDEYSDSYIKQHAVSTPPSATLFRPRKVPGARIVIQGLQVKSVYSVPDSPSVRAIQDCFGISGNALSAHVLGPLDIEASPGNIFLLTGPSGSGKSLLLNAIDPVRLESSQTLQASARKRSEYSVGWLQPIDSDQPVIDYMAKQFGIQSAMAALNSVGLAEAFVYLRPYGLLSRGQKYRLRIAALLLKDDPVWLMDEFCADLDPFAAKVVARNLRRHVISSCRIAVLAAANCSHFVEALRPNLVLYLRQNAPVERLTFKEYIDEFCA